MPELNQERTNAGACVLQAKIYVFCGSSDNEINSIEAISETALISNSTARWQLIEAPRNVLSSRTSLTVCPINDTEIVIMGGLNDDYFSDLVVFDTTTKKCLKVIDGEYKFWSFDTNQCA